MEPNATTAESRGTLRFAPASPIRGPKCRAAACCTALAALGFVLSLFLMPETRERSIWDEAATAQKV